MFHIPSKIRPQRHDSFIRRIHLYRSVCTDRANTRSTLPDRLSCELCVRSVYVYSFNAHAIPPFVIESYNRYTRTFPVKRVITGMNIITFIVATL